MWFLGWMSLARLLRGQVLSLREREFVEAAKVSGASPWRIIRKELLPNVVTPILVQATYMLPNFVTSIAGLSFLGVGLVEPTPDWGRMFANGGRLLRDDITYLFFPGIAMVIFVVAFNLLGDSVRDAFDPKTGAVNPFRGGVLPPHQHRISQAAATDQRQAGASTTMSNVRMRRARATVVALAAGAWSSPRAAAAPARAPATTTPARTPRSSAPRSPR